MAPVIIPEAMPAWEKLLEENIFAITTMKAKTQDIRPLKICLLNLMPDKISTENQILRMLSNNLIQLDLTFLTTSSHKSKNTSKSHIKAFYKTFEEISSEQFDALIITGAPVESLPFEKVNYWNEFTTILDWAKENVYASLFLCWAAQGALYYYYGVPKYTLPEKVFGVFPHTFTNKTAKIFYGFDDVFYVPQSRHTENRREDINRVENLEILSESALSGINMVASKNRREMFVYGHSEYDRDTLKNEYDRDIAKGLDIKTPYGYFIDDNPSNDIIVNWKSAGQLFYSNWINHYVYQETKFNLNEIKNK